MLHRKFAPLLLALSLTACAGFAQFLSTFVAVTQEAAQVLDIYESANGIFAKAGGDARTVAAVAVAIDKARSALAIANRLGAGAERWSKGDSNAALAEFRAAYAELVALTGPLFAPAPPSMLLKLTPAPLPTPPPRPLAADPLEG